MTSVEDLAIDVGLGLNTADYEYFIDDVCDLLNDKQNNMIDKDRIVSLCERSNLKIAKDVLYKCYHRSRERTSQRTNQRKRTSQRPRKQEGFSPKWWQTYHNDKIRKRSPYPKRSPLPKGRQIQEKKRRRERKQKEAPVREMNLQFSPKTEDVPTWPGRNASPKRRRSPSPPSPLYRRNNKRRRR